MAVTVSGNTATFYVDGIADGTRTTATPASYSGPRALGNRSDGNGGLVGELNEIMIFSGALTAEEIQALANP